jgi:hypothetical protein
LSELCWLIAHLENKIILKRSVNPVQTVGGTILATVLSVLVTLIITFLFNKLIALPKAMQAQREQEQQAILAKEEAERQYKERIECRLQKVEAAVEALPAYRQQSLQIQQELKLGQQQVKAELKAEQSEIVKLCKTMNESLTILTTEFKEAQAQTNEREKNDLRQKLIREYNLFTDPRRNPTLAWSDMEQKAFMSQVRDYEALGGNDYIHKTVLPAIYALEIVSMEDVHRLEEVMSSRQQ